MPVCQDNFVIDFCDKYSRIAPMSFHLVSVKTVVFLDCILFNTDPVDSFFSLTYVQPVSMVVRCLNKLKLNCLWTIQAGSYLRYTLHTKTVCFVKS